MFEHSEQASPISESVVEIQINIHLAREISSGSAALEPMRHDARVLAKDGKESIMS
jgi:hypothetical protein